MGELNFTTKPRMTTFVACHAEHFLYVIYAPDTQTNSPTKYTVRYTFTRN